MAQILSTGKVVDTGVAQESPMHAIMESPAHQRQAYPFVHSDNIGFTLYFGGLSIYARVFESDSASMINICSDTGYVGMVTFVQNDIGAPQSTYYDMGTDDDRGFDMTAPIVNPGSLTFTGGTPVWSNSSTGGSPYYKSSLMAGMEFSGTAAYPDDEPDGGPFLAWCCPNNTTADWTDQTWYDAGTWTFTITINEGDGLQANNGYGDSGPDYGKGSNTNNFGMQDSFTATLNFGGTSGVPLYTVTGNITDGWSGDGVSGNGLLDGDTVGERVWQATVTLTFATRWQFNATFGPIDFTQPGSLNPDIYGDGPVPTGTFYCAGGQVSISGSN
jgi:hypothetical protein